MLLMRSIRPNSPVSDVALYAIILRKLVQHFLRQSPRVSVLGKHRTISLLYGFF